MIAPLEFIASTIGTDIKFVPVIVSAVCVFSITVGEIDDIVGLVSPTVTLPPKDTAEPLIVIAEFDNLALAIEPANLSFVTAELFIFAVVILLSTILAVETELSTGVYNKPVPM